MIHCIGNSHINNFSNEETLSYVSNDERFKLYHIGPVIAFNFLDHHMPKVYPLISGINKAEDYICLVAGEVDCRLHLPLQADRQGVSDEYIVWQCVNRFFYCYIDLIRRKYNVFYLGTHPTTTKNHDMSSTDSPIYGDVYRRNKICLLWNNGLENLCKSYGIPFVNFYRYLVDENNVTKTEYFIDYCHLNSKKIFGFLLKELEDKKVIT